MKVYEIQGDDIVEHESYARYLMDRVVPDVTHPIGLKPELALVEVDYLDCDYEEACREAGIELKGMFDVSGEEVEDYLGDREDHVLYAVVEYRSHKSGRTILFADEDEDAATDKFKLWAELKYEQRIFCYFDREEAEESLEKI